MKKSLLALTVLCFLAIGYAIPQIADAQEPFLGEIRMFAGNFAPRGWAFCDGQLLSISQNSALFAILGTTYGGDGRTTFALPDLRGRAPIHAGSGPGLTTRRLGERGGVEDVTLSSVEMPSHNHNIRGTSNGASATTPINNVWASTSRTKLYGPATNLVPLSSIASGPAGSGMAHENMPPFLTVHYIIALQGLFPSRN